MNSRRPHVLFVSRSLAVPNHHGGCVYAAAVLRFLAEHGCDLSYLWLAQPVGPGRPVMRVPVLPMYLRSFNVPQAAKLGPLLVTGNWKHWSSITPFLFSKYILGKRPMPVASNLGWRATAEERSELEKIIRAKRPDAVIIDGTEIAGVIPSHQTDSGHTPVTLLLTHNVLHQRTESYQEHGIPFDFLAIERSEEACLLGFADILIAIQEKDGASLQSMCPEKEVIVAPMPAITRPLPTENQIAGRCIFVGGATQHNIDGLRWFLQQIWPVVLQQVPHASLSVCGSVRESFPDNYPHCTFHGNVSDLTSAYEEASVAIVPLRSGSGLKIKLVEAISYGRAVVSTSIGVQGISMLEDGGIVPVADNPNLFGEHLVSVLRDAASRDRIVRDQTAWAQEQLQPEHAFARLLRAIFSNATQAPRQ